MLLFLLTLPTPGDFDKESAIWSSFTFSLSDSDFDSFPIKRFIDAPKFEKPVSFLSGLPGYLISTWDWVMSVQTLISAGG